MKYLSKFSIKLFLTILILVILPLFAVTLFGQRKLEQTLQERISDSIIQNISMNQSYINNSLMDMAYYSNMFVNDDELKERISMDSYSTYENMQYFDYILRKSAAENPSDIRNNAKVILFDKYGRVYSNWSLNYRNYEFILQEDWVRQSKEGKGFIEWSIFQPSYIEEEKDKTYISLARSILENEGSGSEIGTLIISISQEDVSKLMLKYAYEEDQACICIDEGEILLTTEGDVIDQENMSRIYEKTIERDTGKLKEIINEREYLISYSTFPYPWRFGEHEMKLFHFTDYSPIKKQMETSMSGIEYVTYCSLFLIVIFSFILSRKIVDPLTKLTKRMKHYDMHEDITDLDLERKDEIGSLNRGFVQMNTQIQGLFEELKEESEIKEKYHYESLRAQLNPHFLFNTLNSIRWLAMIRKADNIVESIDAVSSILKYSIGRDEGMVYLADELQNITDYIYIHSLRYAEMIHLNIDVEEKYLKYKTLKFILQPIVENAVLHGLSEGMTSLSIDVTAWQEEECLYLSVSDDGVGVTTEFVQCFEEEKKKKVKTGRLTGIGLSNVDEYLRLRFGEKYGISLKRKETGGTEVRFCIPVIVSDEK